MPVKTVDAGIQCMDNGKFRVNVMFRGERQNKVVDTLDEARDLRNEFKAGRKKEVVPTCPIVPVFCFSPEEKV